MIFFLIITDYFRMNTSEALEWLLEHQDDPDEEENLELPDLDEILDREAGPSTSGSLRGARRSTFKESVVKLFKKSNSLLGCTKFYVLTLNIFFVNLIPNVVFIL